MGLKVLSALDTAKTQFYHFKAIIVAGMGLFTDAYDLFCINSVIKLIGRIYYTNQPRSQLYEIPPAVKSSLLAVPLLGTVVGQIVFGALGDRVGRRRVYGLALAIMVFSSIGCGFSICTTRSCVLLSLGFFRFILGLGIGGDYPLSATIMSEFANKRTRGAFIAAVFSMQGFGILAGSMVTMTVCSIFDRATEATVNKTPKEADIAWRLILMLGAVPAALTYYWRMMIPETARFSTFSFSDDDYLNCLCYRSKLSFKTDRQMDNWEITGIRLWWRITCYRRRKTWRKCWMSRLVRTEDNHSPSTPSYPLFSKEFFWRHGRDLFACSAAWFLVDVVFYSSNLFQSQIYNRYLRNKTQVNAYQDAYNNAKLQAIVAACSTIPGYFFTVYFIDRIGRVKIQVMGFLLMAVIYLSIGIPYYLYWEKHTNAGFMILYGLTFFYAKFGPNTTAFIVPAELFPARFRSTCHGISGAVGKVGAVIGSVGFLWASHKDKSDGYPKGMGMTASLVILGGVSMVGAVISYFFTRETMDRSLEENEKEEDDYELPVLRCLRASGVR